MKKKPKVKTVAKLKKEAWKLLSEIVRRGAADDEGYAHCYTCDNTDLWRSLQAGHGIGGRTAAVLFDESILRPQCVGCNVFKRGNYQIFTTKLIKENGLDWMESKLVDSKKIVKFTRQDLLDKIEDYKQRLEELHAS